MKLEFHQVSHIHNRSQQVYNIHNVNFSFNGQQNIAILSTQARSNSSLLNLISGIQQPTRGIIKREGIFTGPIGESVYFHGELSVEENIRFICKIYGQNTNQVIKDIKEFANLGKELRRKMKSIPQPMKRKTAISLSLMMKVDVYQLKGELTHPQPVFNKRIQDRLADITKQTSLIIDSEDPNVLNKYADTAIVIDTKGFIEVYSDIQLGINAHKSLKKDA